MNNLYIGQSGYDYFYSILDGADTIVSPTFMTEYDSNPLYSNIFVYEDMELNKSARMYVFQSGESVVLTDVIKPILSYYQRGNPINSITVKNPIIGVPHNESGVLKSYPIYIYSGVKLS